MRLKQVHLYTKCSPSHYYSYLWISNLQDMLWNLNKNLVRFCVGGISTLSNCSTLGLKYY